MKIEVTQKHIDSGQHHSSFCPIALALWDEGYKNIFVTRNEIYFKGDLRTFKYAPTQKIRRFIDRYDNGKTVKPQTFSLNKNDV